MTGTIHVTADYPNGVHFTNQSYAYVTVAAGVAIGNPSGVALYGNLGTIDLTIANSGSIAATGSSAGSYGIALQSAGTVANAGGGLISGVYGGVEIAAAGTVANQGSIVAVATASGAGVALGSGAITNSGAISGGNDGVFVSGTGLVSNTGSIGGANGNGVVITGAGAVVNAALSTIAGYQIGVSIGSGGTLVNEGSIISRQTSGSGGAYDTATQKTTFFDVGAVLSSGGVSNASGATISSYFFGVAIYDGGSLENSGSINGAKPSIGVGAFLLNGGSISNAASGTISGGYEAIVVEGANAGSVRNDGVIQNGNFRSAVDLLSGGYFGNTGTVLSGHDGVHINRGGSVHNAGSINGVYISVIAGQPAIVDNAGTMTSSAYKAGAVVRLLSGGTITNEASGTLSGTYIGAQVYSNATGASPGTILNQGLVLDSETLAGAAGIWLKGTGLISNGSSGTISAGDIGIVAYSFADTVVNAGTVSTTRTGAGAVVRLKQGGTISNAAAGILSGKWIGAQVYSNATGSAPGTILNQGLVLAADSLGDGAGAWMKGPGLISNGSSGTISGGAFGVVTYNYADTVVNQGVIFATEFAVAMGSGGANRVIVSPGAAFTGTVNGGNPLTATVASVLELTAGSGIGSITGFGSKYVNFAQVALDAGASWSLAGTVVAGETISFGGAGALTLTNPGSVGGTISGFGAADTIALAGVTDATSATLGTGNVLTVARSGGGPITLQLDPGQTFSSASFPFTVEGGNTDLIVPCFAAGTRILTPAGEVPVEALRAGDPVVLARGGMARVAWIGRRRVDCRAHRTPRAVLPVRIRAGAIAPGVPARDLFLSPDHAVHVDGVLIPARCLINGHSIVQVPVDAVTYFHVELPRHDVLLAEGLAAESYLDTGNRSAFAPAEVRAAAVFSG